MTDRRREITPPILVDKRLRTPDTVMVVVDGALVPANKVVKPARQYGSKPRTKVNAIPSDWRTQGKNTYKPKAKLSKAEVASIQRNSADDEVKHQAQVDRDKRQAIKDRIAEAKLKLSCNNLTTAL